MNRNVKILMGLTAAAMMTACSSMEPDSDDRFSGLLPADFQVAEFAKVNPDVVAIQAAASITSANTAWIAANGEEASTEAVAADSKAFWDNLDQVQTIHTRYLNQVWRGVDSLGLKEREAIQRFNKYGTNDDLAYVENFLKDQVDSNLLMVSYISFGKAEGRPYRFCTDQDAKKSVKSWELPGVLVGTTTNYSAYAFCQQGEGADATLYVVE